MKRSDARRSNREDDKLVFAAVVAGADTLDAVLARVGSPLTANCVSRALQRLRAAGKVRFSGKPRRWRLPLTEKEWREVFRARCASKSGHGLDAQQTALVERAWGEDPERYKAMNPDVFDATVPFGSNVKARR